jgi:phage-related protein
MKEIKFIGNTLDTIREFPESVKQRIGFELDKVQRGFEPSNWKPMNNVAIGVKEIRMKSNDGIFRTIYVAKFSDYIYVLSAFQKKQQKTPKSEVEIARKRYGEINK